MSRAGWIGHSLGYALMDRWLSRRREAREPLPIAIVGRAPAADAPERAAVIEREVFAPALLTQTASAAERLETFMDRFCYVRSDYARQWAGTDKETGQPTYGWTRMGKLQPEACALTPAVIEAHLRGRMTVGTYLLDTDDRCRLLVLDHDDTRRLPEINPATGQRRVVPEDGLALLQDCRERLRQQGIDCAVSESRRGGHLFVFLEEPMSARDVRALACVALGEEEVERMARGEEAFEVYPKQDRRGERSGAVGSNIALPLGIHLKDGQRHPFVDAQGDAVARTLSGQLDYIAGITRCPGREILEDRPWLRQEWERASHPVRLRGEPPAPALAVMWPQQTRQVPAPGMAERGGMIARWKAAVDCRDIVRAYGVELDHNGSGRCPFHDDQHASFQAWADGWRCYAENRGGDALHFVMEQEGMSPKEALAYVRGRFPVPGLELGESQPSGRA